MATIRYEPRHHEGKYKLFVIVSDEDKVISFEHDPSLMNEDYFELARTQDPQENYLKRVAANRKTATETHAAMRQRHESTSSLLRPGHSTVTLPLDASLIDIENAYRELFSSALIDPNKLEEAMRQRHSFSTRLSLTATFDGYKDGLQQDVGTISVIGTATIEQFLDHLQMHLPIGMYLDSTRWTEAINSLKQHMPNLISNGNPQKMDLTGGTVSITMLKG